MSYIPYLIISAEDLRAKKSVIESYFYKPRKLKTKKAEDREKAFEFLVKYLDASTTKYKNEEIILVTSLEFTSDNALVRKLLDELQIYYTTYFD